MAIFSIKRGDTSPSLRYDLIPDTVDLSNATVRFSLASPEGAPVIYRAPAAIVRQAPPVVQYNWQPGDTARAGFFDGEFEVTYPGGTVETFPNSGFITVEIQADAGWRPQAQAGTITWTLGDSITQPLVLTDDDGQPLDLTGATVTVNLRVGATWTRHDATIHDPLIGEAWPDWTALALTPRVYPVTVTITWPDEARETDPQQFVLNVVE